MKRGYRSTKGIALLCGASLLSACSTYGGQKLGKDGAGVPIKPTGIPYMLVKPEYSLNRVVPATAGDKPTYTVAVSYQPDPEQQYTLRPRTGFLADPDFTITLGAGSTITGVKTVISEQFTPTVKAIGSFAANLAALGVFDIGSSQRDDIITLLTGPDCTGTSENRYLDPTTLKVQQESVIAVLTRRLRTFDTDVKLAAQFHYADRGELKCLTAIRKGLSDANDAKRLAWKAADTLYNGDDGFRDLVRAAVDKVDRVKLAEAQLMLAQTPPAPASLKASRQALFDLASTYLQAMADPFLALMNKIVDMDDANWRARHLQYLEGEIRKAELALLRHPAVSAATRQSTQRYFADLRLKRAETIGAAPLYARSLALEALINTVTLRGQKVAKPVASEIAAARAELDLVNGRIDAARTAILDAAKPAVVPVKALSDVSLVHVDAAQITQSTAAVWDKKITVDGVKRDAPDFVIVLE